MTEQLTREKVLAILSAGGIVGYNAWVFSSTGMSCYSEGCCEDSYASVEEAVESLEHYCQGHFEEAYELQ